MVALTAAEAVGDNAPTSGRSNGSLLLASWYFYAWWDWRYVGLLLLSIAVNFHVGTRISLLTSPLRERSAREARRVRVPWLTIGIVFNLGLLGFFKYAGFFVQSANTVLHTGFTVPEIVLPLGRRTRLN